VISIAVSMQAVRQPWARISAVAVALGAGYAICA
jgi:hypothetical protein